MADTVKVIVWGTAEHGACAYYRAGRMFDKALLDLGIEVRHISNVGTKPTEWLVLPNGQRREVAWEVNKEEIEWADVLLFRRYYNTAFKCGSGKRSYDGYEIGCGFTATSVEEAQKHEHGFKEQDTITRIVWEAVRDHWSGGIVYDTDDDHWEIKPWNGYYADVVAERDLILDMTRRADVVTVSTPRLAKQYGRYNPRVRVVRNAIDIDTYVPDRPRPERDRPALVYYGSTVRLRDYAGRYFTGKKEDGAGHAWQAVEAQRGKLHRVFIGTNKGTEHVIGRFFDEDYTYIEHIEDFNRALANTYPDIGIAPLAGDDFDQAKSELHWLEYAVTGGAFIGQRFRGDGPYQVVREGVDGLLARGAQEWHDAVKALTNSQDLRVELAGNARERVLREYDYRIRAQEWAEVFRFAAENPGIGARKVAA